MADRTPKQQTKLELINRITQMLGYTPVGIGDTISLLTHPDSLPFLEAYIKAVKESRE